MTESILILNKKLHSAKNIAVILILLVFTFPAFSQPKTIVQSEPDRWHKIIIAGKQYDKGPLHKWLFGSHYRKEWITPVKVNIIRLDSAYGGLIPTEKGGGRQTRNLRLEDKNRKQYVLRTIDKTYKRALPEIFTGTFVETIANDQVSVAHPYSAITVTGMARAANIYHTIPKIFFIADDKKLGKYSEEFSNQLYLLEERPDENQSNSPNFGNAENVIGTEKMMENISAENSFRVDQEAWLRARLFDMFLGDWGRHEDQWRWGEFKKNNSIIYKPIPRDRDQAYTKFDGLIVSKLAPSAALGYIPTFDYTIKDINKYNFQARHLDRRFANEPSRQIWVAIAKDLQQKLTDAVIETSVKELPPEVFSISGPEIIAKLKSRRDHIVDYANDYYSVLATEVDIPGSKQNELFEISNSDNGEVLVNIHKVDNKGNKTGQPIYTRTFLRGETKEIRIYGLDGNDHYNITYPGSAIKIRLIGGPRKDIFNSSVTNNNVIIYDNTENEFNTSGKIKLHLSKDSSIHQYKYDAYKLNKNGIKPGISYNVEDRIYLTLGYTIQKQQWRKTPFGYQHDVNINYSITQKAFSAQYKGVFNQLIGKWNVGLLANYDLVRDVYYAGVGNNTVKAVEEKKFYKMRTREFNSALSFIRPLDSNNTVSLTGFYKMVKVLKDDAKFILVNHSPLDPGVFNQHNFAGAMLEYLFENINDSFVPTKGIKFSTSASYTTDLTAKNSFTRFTGLAGFYFPVLPSVILAVKAGGATVTGQPPFYELNKLGGGSSLRGHFRYRFYGKTSFYNQNELQWNINIKSWLMNGKIGLLSFFDNGRVWQPREVSKEWHTGYGFGLMIAPFNKFSLTASYGMSKEINIIHLRLGKLL